ncbi:peptidoglycan DD-metalloendopeptidase family protein [Streptoverticillium reticulum]|uniref:peptidoglycan DD-metalloendopeptidase family protein n=1 Tax=Streptoverticillium reticulum TaxID=1433415 RepID=UPI0039BF2DD4
MASNSPVPDGSSHPPYAPHDPHDPYASYERASAAGPGEWNPGEDSAPATRGRHRVAKQRGGSMARSSAVLGVGVIAAVGASGMATAQDRPAPPISVPDVPDLKELPEMAGKLLGVVEEESPAPAAPQEASESANGSAAPALAQNAADAGEALRARILQQAEHQQDSAEEAARQSETKAAEDAHRKAAAEEAAKAKEAESQAGAEKAPQSEGKPEGKTAPEEPKPSAPSRSEHGSYVLPVGSYTLTAGFGQSGNMWSANHTGEDFAAPTGTPVKAVGGGTITQAGWAGAYGYRIVLTLDDGTELWFCHLSSMVVTSGKVAAGDVIGRVGATGNVTGPHLHLEVRPDGGGPVDPLPWLRDKGLQP